MIRQDFLFKSKLYMDAFLKWSRDVNFNREFVARFWLTHTVECNMHSLFESDITAERFKF